MKRVLLFLATNIAVLLTLGIAANVICALLGTSIAELVGPEWAGLVIFAFVYGVIGAFISLLLSRPMAKFACGARTIDGSEGEAERWLVQTVEDLAMRAGVKTPEVAIYPGPANAFATGAFRNHALVAVSTDIMRQMGREELRAVLGHEMSHVSNGDMVTLTLVQGVLNAFVLFFSRALASILSNTGGDGRRRGSGGLYVLLVLVLQTVLGVLASLVVLAFSRRREYAADAGSAALLGSPSPMIAALRRLGNLTPGVLPESLRAMGIAEGGRKTSIWASHPSIADRIAALQNLGASAPSPRSWRAAGLAVLLPVAALAADAARPGAIVASPLPGADVPEPSIVNEIEHAVSSAPADARSISATPFEDARRMLLGTNSLNATATALRLVSAQRSDGRWVVGTNDLTAAAVTILTGILGADD